MKNLVLKETQATYTLTLDEAMLDEGPVRVLRVEGEHERTIGVLVSPDEYAAFCAWREAQQRPQPIQQATSTFQREVEAFERMRPELLREYRGQVVAVHGGQIVEVGHPGESVAEVAGRVYDRLGYVPVCVQQVEDTPRVYRIAGPRLSSQ